MHVNAVNHCCGRSTQHSHGHHRGSNLQSCSHWWNEQRALASRSCSPWRFISTKDRGCLAIFAAYVAAVYRFIIVEGSVNTYCTPFLTLTGHNWICFTSTWNSWRKTVHLSGSSSYRCFFCFGNVTGCQVIFITGRIAAYYAEAFRQSCDLEVFEIHSRMTLGQPFG